MASERVAVKPGQLFAVTTPNSHTLALRQEPDALAQERMLPFQYGLTNRTDPGMQLDCTWYVTDAPAITVAALDSAMTTTFDGSDGRLYFVVAEPPQLGEGVAQAFSDTTLFAIPANIGRVDVSLTLNEGMWRFTFSVGQ